MRVNFDGHGVTWSHDDRRPLHPAPCKMLEVSQYLRVYILVKNGGLPSNLNANHLFWGFKWKGCTFMEILPHLGGNNNPSLNAVKKEFGSPVITGEIWSEINNMAAGFS